MMIDGCSGEYFFKAIWRHQSGVEWELSRVYYSSLEDAKSAFKNAEVLWPVEVRDGDILYVPNILEYV